MNHSVPNLRQYLALSYPERVRVVCDYFNFLVEEGALRKHAERIVATRYMIDERTVRRYCAAGRKSGNL